MASATAADAPPSVSVILVNLDGAEHLPDCLDSLRAQDYPRERLDVIVVDNGSTDGSLEMLADRYPWVRVLAQGTNTGFAPAVNTGVRAATGACVALLNNDMRADPGWVSSLVDGYDPASGVVCVAGQILSWDGTEVDFVEGTVNFYGMGNQVAFGR
ncbi:MAG: glycosyltransferase, partial [Acidimicrobiia bacterium]|nr:glycosyltransferase [Acidimicrobiia bacterium]